MHPETASLKAVKADPEPSQASRIPCRRKHFQITHNRSTDKNHASYCTRSPTANILRTQIEPKLAARFENFRKIITKRTIPCVSRLGRTLALFRPGYYKVCNHALATSTPRLISTMERLMALSTDEKKDANLGILPCGSVSLPSH
jgi:hypothetical protein